MKWRLSICHILVTHFVKNTPDSTVQWIRKRNARNWDGVSFPYCESYSHQGSTSSLKTGVLRGDSLGSLDASPSGKSQDPPGKAEAQGLPEISCRAPKSARGLPWRNEPWLDSYLSRWGKMEEISLIFKSLWQLLSTNKKTKQNTIPILREQRGVG